MFTVRIDRGRGNGHEVFSCARYRVTYERPAMSVRVRMTGVVGQETPEEVDVSVGDRVFVMNEHGNTIDQISSSRRES